MTGIQILCGDEGHEERNKTADADAQLEYYKRIEELRSKQELAQGRLKELKEAGEDAWEDLKAGVELAWNSLGEAVKSAGSRFK